MLTSDQVLTNLCVRDPRNPEFLDVYGDFELCELPEPRVNCFCDSCFRGNDQLAIEILRLETILKGAKNETHNGTIGNPGVFHRI